MRAIVCSSFGPPEHLRLVELPEPVAGNGEVVVAVEATGLNFMDTLIIEGRYQFKPDFPFSPGAECAGTITSLGADVEGWSVGDRVLAWTGWNACREAIAVPADHLIRIPQDVSFEAAAGLSVAYGTAIHALQDRAQLQPGETLAVLGAAGGTGLAAVEVGKRMGARVIACASSPEKLALAREKGADETIDYRQDDLKAALKRLTGGAGVDVVYDPVGDDLAEPAIRALAWEGRYLVVGFAGGEIPRIPLNLLLLKGCDLRGVFWGEFTKREPAAHATNMACILAWMEAGDLSVHIGSSYPLERTPEALQMLARREASGKIVIRPRL